MNSRSFTGVYIDLINPNLQPLRLEDFSVPLSRICRFTGSTTKFYSVAAHSLFVSELCSFNDDIQRYALIHDAHEALIGDVSRPVKQVLGAKFKKFEDDIQAAVLDRFGCYPNQYVKDVVKHFDNMALHVEASNFMVAQDWVRPPFLVGINSEKFGEEGCDFWAERWQSRVVELFGRGLFK